MEKNINFTNEETKGIIRVGGKTEEIVQFILNRRTEVLQNFLAAPYR